MTNFQKNLNDQMSKNALTRVVGFASSKFLGFGIWSLRFKELLETINGQGEFGVGKLSFNLRGF